MNEVQNSLVTSTAKKKYRWDSYGGKNKSTKSPRNRRKTLNVKNNIPFCFVYISLYHIASHFLSLPSYVNLVRQS